jgi:predicted transcriptional regulator
MPNAPKTTARAIRLDDKLWLELGELATAMGTDRASLLRQFAEWMVRRPGARLPARPARNDGTAEG